MTSVLGEARAVLLVLAVVAGGVVAAVLAVAIDVTLAIFDVTLAIFD